MDRKNRPPADIVPIPNWREDATSDENFSRVMASSFGVVGSKTDLAIVLALLVFGAIGVFIAQFGTHTVAQAAQTAKMLQQWTAYLGRIAVSILGFLIAGFAVFATITRPELFHILAKFRVHGRRISEFKFVFYNFIYIFGHYIIFLALCLVISIGFVTYSPIWFAGKFMYKYSVPLMNFSTAILAVIVASYAVYILLLLRSFLWNLYQTLLFAIFFDEGA